MKHTDIIRRVMITEKGTKMALDNRYMLEVVPEANKYEIKQAVEAQFGVHVLAVRTQTYKGELRVLRNRRTVRESKWKRAIVTVKPGERIEVI
ncbi:MAG: 50S ribosomal protein L23 [Kiritimatiellae bacterium]|nr:50S ribosomal protein L23 [Kiritimatiellia bacterium]MBP5225889.1 50S ribosomal protein L23 [Kiritimatiellia bacterium]